MNIYDDFVEKYNKLAKINNKPLIERAEEVSEIDLPEYIVTSGPKERVKKISACIDISNKLISILKEAHSEFVGLEKYSIEEALSVAEKLKKDLESTSEIILPK